MHEPNQYSRRCAAASVAGCLLLLPSLAGCVAPGPALSPSERAVADAARPLLDLDPNAVWGDSFNRLVALGPVSLEYLAERPEMTQPAAPDNLRVLLHTSLLRLLASPADAPRLTLRCYETTLGLLHFDPKCNGQRVGTVALLQPGIPRVWHALYPADVDQRMAGQIDAEQDRLAMRQWWLAHRDSPSAALTTLRLTPRADDLWRLLSRRPADLWLGEVQPRPLLGGRASSMSARELLATSAAGSSWSSDGGAAVCMVVSAGGDGQAVLLQRESHDYNLVRAACVWLGSSRASEVRGQLIELVGSPAPVIAHNARFALGFSDDPRIRELLDRYKRSTQERASPESSEPERWDL